ncbi:hypothetical protein INT45_013350 [Circinella minor]|uniref:Uncharacterized protein n=1 Tax=Circinella minor TaxID=1195481 RepID=A0A8H7RVR1_9FUNG|nr:hypothetical protein INT45_013350 [Circinella minor]
MTRSTSLTASASARSSNKSRTRFLFNRPPDAPRRTPIPSFVSSSGWVQTGLGPIFRKAQKQDIAKRQLAPRHRLRGPRVSSVRVGFLVVATATIAPGCHDSSIPSSPVSSPLLFHISSVNSSLSSLSTLPALSPGSSPPVFIL